MIRFAGGGLIGFLLIALWLYCILDVIATDEILMRSLPKMAWLLIVIILPDIGSIAWLALGRPQYAGWRPGDTEGRPTRRIVGPEDRPDFGVGSGGADAGRLEAWETDLQRREQELRRQKREDPPAAPTSW
ncbi:MAG: PLDc N-terminal domain-containing protein [Acidimicrobiales bacterium]